MGSRRGVVVLDVDDAVDIILDIERKGVVSVQLRDLLLKEYTNPTTTNNNEQQAAAVDVHKQLTEALDQRGGKLL